MNIRSGCANFLFVFSLMFCFVGCSSTNKALQEKDALAMLNTDALLYLYIPTASHKELVTDVMKSISSSMTDKNASTVADHIDSVFISLGSNKKLSNVEIVALGSFPSVAVNSQFTKKKGWEKVSYKTVDEKNKTKKFNYYKSIDNANNLQISFPSSSICTISSKDVTPLLDSYSNGNLSSDEEYTSWFENGGDDILFYAVSPGKDIWKMFNLNIFFNCTSLYGKFSSSGKDMYNLSLSLSLPDKLVANAAKAILLLLGGDVKLDDDLTISVGNIPVTKQFLEEIISQGVKLVD